MAAPRILLIIGGGIAAYKSIELVRLLRKAGYVVRCVITRAGEQFVTPLQLDSLSEYKVYTNLFDLNAEVELGQLQFSRETVLGVVATATAYLLAQKAESIAEALDPTMPFATPNLGLGSHARTWHN